MKLDYQSKQYSIGPSNDLIFKLVFNSLISRLFIILILSADFLSLNPAITNADTSFTVKTFADV